MLNAERNSYLPFTSDVKPSLKVLYSPFSPPLCLTHTSTGKQTLRLKMIPISRQIRTGEAHKRPFWMHPDMKPSDYTGTLKFWVQTYLCSCVRCFTWVEL